MKKCLVNIAISLASLLLCAVLLEVASRLLFDAPPSVEISNLSGADAEIDPVREYEDVQVVDGRILSKGIPDPGFYIHTPTGRRLRRSAKGTITGHHLARADIEFSTNSLGYRDDELPAKTERDYRILVLGDSITLGDYVQQDQTYPALIQRALIEAGHPALEGRNVRVINAGVGAIDLQNEFAILMETGLSVEPDVVLVGLFLNDAYHSFVLDITQLSKWIRWSHFLRVASLWIDVFRDRDVYEKSGLRDEEAIAHAREEYLATHSAVKGDWRVSREAFDYEIGVRMDDWGYAWTDDYWRKVVPILEMMKRVGAERGFELVVMLFPVNAQVHSELLVDEPQQEFERSMTELGVAHLDLLPKLREKYQRDGVDVFYDHCHYRVEGNRFIADTAADFLLREVIER
jgi:hypothetical protein